MTGVSAARIRRWLRGYSYRSGDKTRVSARVWKPDLAPIDHALALSFRDLIEVRFVDFFLRKGVTWKEIRAAAACAAELANSTHPFSTKKFKTDGRKIFAKLQERGGNLRILQLVEQQYAIGEVLDPLLYAGIEFRNLDVIRWFPMDPSRRVVVDPTIAFGQPVVRPEAVPTRTLFRAYRADQEVDVVAKAYSVSKSSVLAAVEYETHLAA